MKKRVYYLILLELVIVLTLTTAWEFGLEDFTFELFKSQITKLKSQINPKLQNSNPKQISEYIESNQFGLLRHERDVLSDDAKSA